MSAFSGFEKNRVKHAMVHKIQGHTMKKNIIFYTFIKKIKM